MRILPGAQGSAEWRANRRGMPTASQFHRILSPAKLELSAQSHAYLCELVAERLLGIDVSADASQFMERGTIMEEEAVRYYEFTRNVTTKAVGLCVRDLKWDKGGPDGVQAFEETVGCSPDRFVGEEGGLELKCPSAAVHVGYLLDGLGTKYRLQVQGALWITGRKWWDLLSYNPDLPPALERIYPDPEVFAAFHEAVPAFLEQLAKATEHVSRLLGKLPTPPPQPLPGPAVPVPGPVAPAPGPKPVPVPEPVREAPNSPALAVADEPEMPAATGVTLQMFYSLCNNAEKTHPGRVFLYRLPQTEQVWFVDDETLDRALVGNEKAANVLLQDGARQCVDAVKLVRLHDAMRSLTT